MGDVPVNREMKMNTMLKTAVIALSLSAGAAFAQAPVATPVSTAPVKVSAPVVKTADVKAAEPKNTKAPVAKHVKAKAKAKAEASAKQASAKPVSTTSTTSTTAPSAKPVSTTTTGTKQ